jgi:hypothetical protein
MRKYFLVTWTFVSLLMSAAFIGGTVLGTAVTLHYVPAEAPPVEEGAHLLVLRTCKLPDANGAMTVFVMEEDKHKCWRWK